MTDLQPKICIASSGLGHVARGIEAWAQDLGHALLDRGLDVRVCRAVGPAAGEHERVVRCWTRESPQARRLIKRLPRFLGWRLGLGNGYGVEQSTFAWNLLGILRREEVDLLHVQDPQLALLVQRARRVGLVGTRTILAHGTEEPLEFQRRITYLQHLAPWHLEESRAAGVWKPTWTAIPNFIDTLRFAPAPSVELRRELNIPTDAQVVLCAAAIKRHHKRIDYILDEFAKLRQQRPDLPAYLVIAGGWEQDTDALVREGEQRLGDRVRFLIRFPRQRMPDLYRAADAFVLGSLKEMMPIALLEATACGLPCVVNRHAVMEWMIGQGGSAIDMTVDGRLAAELASLLSSRERCRAVGEQARRHCEENFSRDAVVDQILAYYDQVLAGAPPAFCRVNILNMNVSVVIPTYNSGALVVEAVESVLRQSCPARQVIVVDDGSTDDTALRLAPYRDQIELLQQPNRRVAAARNAGLERATGDVIAFLDADDVWHPQKLEQQLTVLRDQPQIGLLATNLTDWPGTFPPAAGLASGEVAKVPLSELLVSNPLATSSIVVRREVLEQVGRFDTSLFGPEDYDLWLRCAQTTEVAMLKQALTGYRETQGSLSKQAETMRRGLLAIHAKLDAAGVWPNAWFRRKCRAHMDYSVAYMYYAAGRPRTAARHLVQSLASYPCPLPLRAVRYYGARLRLLFRSVTASWRTPA